MFDAIKNFDKKTHTNSNENLLEKFQSETEESFPPSYSQDQKCVSQKVEPAKINVFPLSSGAIILAQERTLNER